MAVFEMVFGIVLVTAIAGMYNQQQKTKARMHQSASRDEGLNARVRDLEDRVKVLEAIVTDEKRNLKREIDGL